VFRFFAEKGVNSEVLEETLDDILKPAAQLTSTVDVGPEATQFMKDGEIKKGFIFGTQAFEIGETSFKTTSWRSTY
jgi:hypothetical protein